MESRNFDEQFRSLLPEETQPWVVAALRQDQTVWQSLQDPRLYEKALLICRDQPLAWTPGSLSLLALNLDVNLEFLRSLPLEPLESDLRQRAYRAYEHFLKDISATDQGEIQAENLEKPSSSRSFSPIQSPFDALTEAGLIGLALRERLRLTGSWNNFSLEILAPSNVSLERWQTPLACLISFIPDPLELLGAFIFPGAPSSGIFLALQAYLSNPLPLIDRLNYLKNLFITNQFVTSNKPDEIVEILRWISHHHPRLAKNLAEWFLEPQNINSLFQDNPGEAGLFEQGKATLCLAEIYQIAGQVEEALKVLTRVRQSARWLQAEICAAWATTAEYDPHSNDTNQSLILHAWKEATENTPESYLEEGKSPFAPHLTSFQLKSGDEIEIRNRLSQITEEYRCLETETNLEVLLTMAQIAQQLGDLPRAIQCATRAASLDIDQNTPPEKISLELLKTNFSRKKESNRRVLAEMLFGLGLYDRSIEVLHRLLSESPNDPELINQLGMALQASFQQRDANQAFQVALMLQPDRVDIHRKLAAGLEAIGDWINALPERQRIIQKLKPENRDELSEAYHALAICALRAENLEQAIEASEKALSINPEDGLAYYYLGEASFKVSQLEKCQDYFNQAIQLTPQFPEPWLGLVKIYRALSQDDKIIDTLKEAVQAAPLAYEIHFELGEEYLKQGSHTQARMSFQRAYELVNAAHERAGDLYWKIAINLGKILLQLGHITEANEILEKAYQRAEAGGYQQPELAFAYAKTLLALGKISPAIPVLREVLKSSPQEVSPYLDYAKALLSTGTDAEEAVQALQTILNREPEHLEAKALLAEAFSTAGDHQNALKAFQASLETDLSKDRKWVARLSFGMGCSALSLGYIDTAIAVLQEAIHADPSQPTFHQKLCDAYWQASLYNNAIQAARSTLNLDTENTDILLWFAEQAIRFYHFSIPKIPASSQEINCDDLHPDRLYGIKPRQILTEAMNALTQANLIAPQRGDILLKLGEIQILAGEREQAVETFRQVQTKDIITLEVLQQTAEWLTKLDQHHAAIACLERAILFLKTNQSEIPCKLFEDLSQAYLRTGKTESALELLHQAIALFPQNEILFLKIAQIYINTGRIENALSFLEDSLNLLEDDEARASIYYHLAQIQRRLGDLPKSLENAERAYQLSEYQGCHEGFDWKHLAKHYLAAELARSILKLSSARKYLESKYHALVSADQLENIDPEAIDTLVGYYCLESELALCDGEEIEAANALTPAVQVAPTHPRTLALQARFQHRRGDDHLALRTLQEALSQLPVPTDLGGNSADKSPQVNGNLYPNPHVPVSERGFTAYDFLSVCEAAVELNQWQLAIYLAESAIESHPQEPYLKLFLVQILIRRAELQILSQNLEIIHHAPGENALSLEQANTAYQLIQAVKQFVDSENNPEAAMLLSTWETRRRAVFEPHHSELEITWEALPLTIENAAAQLIHWLRRTDCLRDYMVRDDLPDTDEGENNQANLRQAMQCSQMLPQSALIQMLTGMVLENQHPTKALDFAQRAAQIQDKTNTSLTAICHYLLARLALKNSDLSIAEQAIETALSIWLDEPRWHALAAEIFILEESSDENILLHLETASQLEPQNYHHFLNLGAFLQKLSGNDPNQLKPALRAFEKASQIKPELPDAWLQIAQTYLLDGGESALMHAAAMADRAISLAEAVPQNGSPLNAYLLRAEIALRAKDPETADQYTQKAFRIDPGNEKAAWLKAQALETLGRTEEALLILEKATHAGAEPLAFQIKKADLYRRTQEPVVALRKVSELAEANPDQPEVFALLAQTLFDAGQKEAAQQAAQRALQSYPNQADLNPGEKAKLHYLIGMISVEAGQLDKAIFHLDQSIELDPSFVEPYLELGFAYNKQRQFLKAQNIFQKATVIAPEDARTFLQTGLALKEGKDYQSAETMLRRAAQLAPSDVQIRKHLAAVAALNLVHNPHNINIAAER